MTLIIPVAVLSFAALALAPAARSFLVPQPGVIADIIAKSRAKPPAEGQVMENLRYRGILHRNATLDLYKPLISYSPGKAPIVVFFHGGSWIHGDKVTVRIIDRFLNRMRSRGYFLAAINYRGPLLSGLKGTVENSAAAVRWLRKHAADFGYNGDAIGLYGISAGGHLALMTEARFRDAGCVSFVLSECSPVDLEAMARGEAFSSSAVLRLFPDGYLRRYSPVRYIGPGMAPVLIYHGDADEVVDVRQASRLYDAVLAAGGHAEIEIYRNGTHAFLGMSDALWDEQELRALKFMDEQFGRN